MRDYLIHWWNADLSNFYKPFGLTIPQLNKVFKVGLYFTAILTIFDLFAFASVMRSLEKVAYIFAYLGAFPGNFYSPDFAIIFFSRLISISRRRGKTLRDIFRKRNLKIALRTTILYKLREAHAGANSHAKSTLFVRSFDWLENHPMSSRSIGILGFVLLILFSLGELLTS